MIRSLNAPILTLQNRIVSKLKEINTLYFIDADGNYQKCHKLLPDIRRIFGDIEYLDGEPVEIITNEMAGKNFNDSLAIWHRNTFTKTLGKYPTNGESVLNG